MPFPGRLNLCLYRGDSYYWEFYFWEDPEREIPVDLTYGRVAAEVREQPGGTTIIKMNCRIELPNIIHVTLEPDESKRLPLFGFWDLELTDPVWKDVVTLLAGTVTVTADVTNSLPLTPPVEPVIRQIYAR